MKTKWLIHDFMLGRATASGFPNLAQAVRDLGLDVHVSSLGNPECPFGPNDCVVTYGSHQFVKKTKTTIGKSWQPGCYHRIDRLSYSYFSPHLGELLLNEDFVILPFGEVVRRRPKNWGGEIFIRPDAVTKSFTGFVVNEQDFDHEVSSLKQISHVEPEMLVVVSKPKQIEREFRFVIADQTVITGSEYCWDDRDIGSVPTICAEVARRVAEHPWQTDSVYVCDVALTENGAKVVELNTFSCAGLYSCDTRKIAEAVSTSAWKEYLCE